MFRLVNKKGSKCNVHYKYGTVKQVTVWKFDDSDSCQFVNKIFLRWGFIQISYVFNEIAELTAEVLQEAMEMSGEYKFCEENAANVQRFIDAVESHPTPENKFRKYFATPHFVNPGKQPPIVVIEDSPNDVDVSPAGEATVSAGNVNFDEEAKYLCEFVETACRDENQSALYEEISVACLKNTGLLNVLAENLSENGLTKLTSNICENNQSNDFIKAFLLKFLLPLVKCKEHTRLIDSLLLETYKKIPEPFSNVFLPDFINEPSISENVFSNFVKALNVADRRKILNELFSIHFTGNQFLTHSPSILALYKCFCDSFTTSAIIKMLCANSEVGSNDKSYGKLLLAVTQCSDVSAQLDVLEGLCLVHQTVFKKACMNALNKLRNL